jgi:putative endonuclease
MNSKAYYVYILTNVTNRVLYIGVTNDLVNRVSQHRQKLVKGFTQRYNINKLVYFETYSEIIEAISREKQLKAGSREKKLQLIEKTNPTFIDLYNTIL